MSWMEWKDIIRMWSHTWWNPQWDRTWNLLDILWRELLIRQLLLLLLEERASLIYSNRRMLIMLKRTSLRLFIDCYRITSLRTTNALSVVSRLWWMLLIVRHRFHHTLVGICKPWDLFVPKVLRASSRLRSLVQFREVTSHGHTFTSLSCLTGNWWQRTTWEVHGLLQP